MWAASAFLDYAQARGFAIDAARVRRPTDEPRVENAVRYARGAWLSYTGSPAQERLIGLARAQLRAQQRTQQ